jgi:hypothetical protein
MSESGTCATCHDEAFRSAFEAKADLQRRPPLGPTPIPSSHSKHSRDLLIALVTDRAMQAWYHPSMAWMAPNRRVTWQATSNDENS